MHSQPSKQHRYQSLWDCMDLWDSECCGSCEKEWWECECLDAPGETLDAPDDGEITVEELAERVERFETFWD